MNKNPFNSLALIFALDGKGGKFLGTATAYNNKFSFLTAAHCVEDYSPEGLVLLAHADGRQRPIKSITRHPKADIAVLQITVPDQDSVVPFMFAAKVLGWGEEYLAIGYPEDSTIGEREARPTLRLLRGHYQRLHQYKSAMGYEYAAGEASTPFPAGMSGGPLFAPELPQSIIGIVAENIRWGREIESIEEVTEAGTHLRIERYAYIHYGIAVMLFDLREWLDELAPLEKQSASFQNTPPK